MISIVVITTVIGTTEPLFELLDHYDKNQHDSNNSKRPSLWPTDGPLRTCRGQNVYRNRLMKRVMAMPDLEGREWLDHLEQLQQSTH